MIELLREAARARPEQVAVVSRRGELTYAELLAVAEAAAAQLVARGISRFGILEEDPATVLALLAGASCIGAEGCVYPLAATDDAVDELATRFDHQVVVTSRNGITAPTVLPADLLVQPSEPVELPDPQSRPIMVFTTGTSGFPRGVRHEWDRLLRATLKIKPSHGHRWLLAYGLNQFGGLQILIHVLAAQSTLVAADSFQPKDGLAAMRRWGVTHASGTPTFWRFLLGELRADGGPVPVIRQVTMGGEAVPSALLEQVHEVFPDANISQIYGATEFGQNVTVKDGRPGLPLSMLDEGGDVAFKIVDDELWVRSRASMLGYYNEESVTKEEWRATGDLVEVVGDRIEFRGRKTDVINVGGVKVHPIPVEDRISKVPGVALARAFGRPNALSGSIVAVEAVLEPGHDPESVDGAIRRACADLPPAARPRSIRFVETMHTTGNKMSRGVNR